MHRIASKFAVALCALALWAGVSPLDAQRAHDGTVPRGVVSGSVLDGETSHPLVGATVVIEPESAGALLGNAPGGGAFLRGSHGVLSDSAGGYRFEDLAPGRYRLRVSRAGYRPATLRVELRGWADSRVSIGLTVEPIPMEAVEVTADKPQPFGRERSVSAEVEGSRVTAARARQRASLSTDARELTHADVVESVTLGETDLFRAFQRLPGISTKDDYTAELWTRGAAWDQTRVYFDGLPLFNPLHGMGVLSGVNPDAVGGALLHPGVRSASLGDGAAGVVDLMSRRGGGDGELRGLADLSLASARLALDQRVLDGRGAWMVAGRRTYLDWLTGGIERMAGGSGIAVPYSFSDLTARFDLRLDDQRAVEASGLLEHDRISGNIPDVLHRTTAGWGNRAGRVTYVAPLGRWSARHTLGLSRYAAVTREMGAESDDDLPYGAPGEPHSDNLLSHAVLAGELAPTPARDGSTPWRAGYELVRQSARYDGPAARPFSGHAPADAEPISRATEQIFGALWGERRWGVGDRLLVEAGLRLEAGEPVANGGAVRAAPRVSARYQLSPEVALSAGVGRTYQYTQTLGPAGPSFHSTFHASQVWLLADEDTPAIRSDIATFGAEAWLGDDWIATANGYLRRATGMAVADPAPGLLLQRPLFVTGENDAHGFELSARRLAGRWTASASYSYGLSEVEANGRRFPAPADRRHALDATAMLRLGSSLRLGAAYTAATGAPFTRLYSHSWSCQEAQTPGCGVQRVGEPNAQRTPAYASLDLLVDWTRRFSAWDLSAYLQLRNALGRDNASTYANSSEWCPGRGYTWRCDVDYQLVDHFEPGLPMLPVFGFRARF